MKYKNGVLIGSFRLPTTGHTYFLRKAASFCEVLTILVCTLPNEQYDPELRYQWICEELKDLSNVIIKHVKTNNPEQPSEHPNFWDIWRDTVLNNIDYPNNLEVILSSEEYGYKLSEVLKCKHQPIDILRKNVSICSTDVRHNIMKNFDYIMNSAKGYFTKKILILGAESTGKTTTCNLLSEYFKCNIAYEYGREFVDQHGFPTVEQIYEIANKQLERENELLRNNATKFLFCDTSAITSKVLSKIYLKNYDYRIDSLIEYQSYDEIFVLDNTIEWVQDGQRLNSQVRKETLLLNISELLKHNREYIVLDKGKNNYLWIINYLEKKYLNY